MKKPEKVWMLIATTIAIISCQSNRAEALMFDWNVTGAQITKMTGPKTAKGTSPVLDNNVYKNAGATGGETNSEGRDSNAASYELKPIPSNTTKFQPDETDTARQFYINCKSAVKRDPTEQALCGNKPSPHKDRETDPEWQPTVVANNRIHETGTQMDLKAEKTQNDPH